MFAVVTDKRIHRLAQSRVGLIRHETYFAHGTVLLEGCKSFQLTSVLVPLLKRFLLNLAELFALVATHIPSGFAAKDGGFPNEVVFATP
jgi:hypothetical protein